jgi:hypothetical protein
MAYNNFNKREGALYAHTMFFFQEWRGRKHLDGYRHPLPVEAKKYEDAITLRREVLKYYLTEQVYAFTNKYHYPLESFEVKVVNRENGGEDLPIVRLVATEGSFLPDKRLGGFIGELEPYRSWIYEMFAPAYQPNDDFSYLRVGEMRDKVGQMLRTFLPTTYEEFQATMQRFTESVYENVYKRGGCVHTAKLQLVKLAENSMVTSTFWQRQKMLNKKDYTQELTVMAFFQFMYQHLNLSQEV